MLRAVVYLLWKVVVRQKQYREIKKRDEKIFYRVSRYITNAALLINLGYSYRFITSPGA